MADAVTDADIRLMTEFDAWVTDVIVWHRNIFAGRSSGRRHGVQARPNAVIVPCRVMLVVVDYLGFEIGRPPAIRRIFSGDSRIDDM